MINTFIFMHYNIRTYMKNLIIAFAVALFIQTSSAGQEVSIMTYNIRYNNVNDGVNRWDQRKETLLGQILFFAPDIFGIQEGLEDQVKYLEEHLPTYAFEGRGRGNAENESEYSAIFFNTKKFEKIKGGTFWLSETPDKPSKGWDAALNRICTYVQLKDKKTKKKFWVFNTHFDHVGDTARMESAKLIIEKIAEMNWDDLPVFLTGDFNLLPESDAIKFLSLKMNDSRAVTQLAPYGPVGTFNGFKVCENPSKRIDYIFTSPDNVVVLKYGVLAEVQDLRYPSDHFPVLVVARIQ